MLAVLEDLRGEHDCVIEVRDVDANPDWRARYGSLVPVVMAGNEEVCRYFPDMPKLREVLDRLRSRSIADPGATHG